MPITPHFHLSQTISHVTIEIKVPHIRVSAETIEVFVDGRTVHFSNPPYLLLLDFPDLFEAEGETAKYDPTCEGGMVTIELKKHQPEYWKDLDLIGQLMKPRKNASILRAQIISKESGLDSTVEDNQPDFSHTFPTESSNIFHINKPHYGFLNLFVGFFSDLVREGLAAEMIQLPCPDETRQSERRGMRLEAEEETFDPDRYLGDLDLDDDYVFQTAMGMESHWKLSTVNALTLEMESLSTDEKSTLNIQEYLSEQEKVDLASISYPILPHDIDRGQRKSLLLGLLDILFAYTYDHLLTEGEPTIESSWTICTLSCTLSWLEEFDAFDEIGDVIRFSIRRSLIYPYIRNYDFALYCWDQVTAILQNGRRCIIRCLLQVRRILDKSEVHYMGNRLYLDPYLCLIQNVRLVQDTALEELGNELSLLRQERKLSACGKNDLRLDLIQLEQLFYGNQDTTTEQQDKEDAARKEQEKEHARNSLYESFDNCAIKRHAQDEHNAKRNMLDISSQRSLSNTSVESLSGSHKGTEPLIVELQSS
mmetsp:Transcript_19677/g.29197  ORF Transcript_19677/g.29197 Transcript_19677/m.29197 type:complete len:536 (-) Transcript_19677:64-1671(-)